MGTFLCGTSAPTAFQEQKPSLHRYTYMYFTVRQHNTELSEKASTDVKKCLCRVNFDVSN